MAALTEELLTEVFRPLERSDLGSLQISCRRFRILVYNEMKRLCLRRMKSVSIAGEDGSFLNTGLVPVSFETHASITKEIKRKLRCASLADSLAFVVPLIRSILHRRLLRGMPFS